MNTRNVRTKQIAPVMVLVGLAVLWPWGTTRAHAPRPGQELAGIAGVTAGQTARYNVVNDDEARGVIIGGECLASDNDIDAVPDDGQRLTRHAIEWPSRQFDSLQAAIDAAPDGGMVQIKPGVYSISAPLMVRGKSLIIAGAGSGRTPRKGPPRRAGTQRITHLMGPVPTEVVDERSAVGLFNYVDCSGVLQDLKLSGFDAFVRESDTRTARPLMVRDCVLTGSSRGCLWYAPSNLIVSDSSVFGQFKTQSRSRHLTAR